GRGPRSACSAYASRCGSPPSRPLPSPWTPFSRAPSLAPPAPNAARARRRPRPPGPGAPPRPEAPPSLRVSGTSPPLRGARRDPPPWRRRGGGRPAAERRATIGLTRRTRDEMPPDALPMDVPFPTFVVGSRPRPEWVREVIEDRKRGALAAGAAQALL